MTEPIKSVPTVKKSDPTLEDAQQRLLDAPPAETEATPEETVAAPVCTITRYAIRRDGNGADVRALIERADGSVGTQTQTVKDPANLRARLKAAIAEGKFSAVRISKGESYTNQAGELMTTSPAFWMDIHQGQAARNVEALGKVESEDFDLEADVPADDKADSSDAS